MTELHLAPQHGLLGVQVWQYYEEGQFGFEAWVVDEDTGITEVCVTLAPRYTVPTWRAHHAVATANLIAYAKHRGLL